MSERIKILVGTMTGTAELVADEMAEVLQGHGVEVEILLMDDVTPDALQRSTGYIICTSTYGQGDVPDNGQVLYQSLCEERPDLAGLRYGVFALGDTTYAQTFCQGGRRFDDILRTLGAERVGDRREHDASSGSLPEDEAADWAEEWHALFAKADA